MGVFIVFDFFVEFLEFCLSCIIIEFIKENEVDGDIFFFYFFG